MKSWFNRSAGLTSLALAAAILSMASAIKPASADTLSYSGYTFPGPYGDSISITTNQTGTINAGGGVIRLNNVTTNPTNLFPSSIQTFCVELTQSLQQGSNTFTIVAQGASKIGGLLAEAKSIFAASTVTTSAAYGSKTWSSMDDVAAAIQIAIWSQIYTVTAYSAGLHNGSTGTQFHQLVDYLIANAQNLTWTKLASYGNQDQAVYGVPGPIVGAGLPGLILACAGLLALIRRRRPKVAV